MPKEPRWRSLLLGIALVSSVALAIAAVFVFARVGALHGETIRLYAATGEARGVMRGSEVWLAGKKVGLVDRIELAPVGADSDKRVLLTLQILADKQPLIRRDTRARIQSGGTIIGSPVLYLTVGSTKAPALRDGDTLTTLPQGDLEGMTSQFAMVSKDAPAIMNDMKRVMAAFTSERGSVGAFLQDERGARELSILGDRTGRLTTRAQSGNGTIGLVMRGSLVERARAALGRAKDIKQRLTNPNGNVGRLRNDSTLRLEVADVRNELAIVRARLASGEGTAGRFVSDSALLREVTSTERAMSALFADMKKHPLRYAGF